MGKLYSPEMIKTWLTVDPNEGDDENIGQETAVASLAAVLTVSAPFALVTVAVFTFIVGFLVYHGFLFYENLDEVAGRHDSLNTFIVLMVVTGLCILFFYLSFSAKSYSAKDYESNKRDHSTPASKFGDGNEKRVNEVPIIVVNDPDMLDAAAGPDSQHPSDLVAALRAAAQAHRQSAASDEAAANLYERFANSSAGVEQGAMKP